MPAFIPLIAAVIGAGATIYATEASRGKGAKAPAFGGGGAGAKGAVETPSLFKTGEGSALLGGKQGAPVASLSQALATPGGTPPQQQFGPTSQSNFLDDEMRRQQLRKLAGLGG